MSIKASLLKRLPESIRQLIRKVYYLQLLKFFKKTPELIFLGSLVKPGNIVVDVGANIGVYTKCLSELVGLSGRVISIEPIPSTFDILSFNMRKLRLHNVTLRNCAISDTDGQVNMVIPTHATGGDNFYEAGIASDNSGNTEVLSVVSSSLDALLKVYNQNISFIKIDVEGHELKVIKGAFNTLKKMMPSLLIEVTRSPEDKSSDAFELFDLLKTLGYRPFLLNGAKLEEYYPGAKSVNYFFIPKT